MVEDVQVEVTDKLTPREKLSTINIAIFIVGVVLIAVSRYGLSMADDATHVPFVSKITLVLGIVACVVSILSLVGGRKKKE